MNLFTAANAMDPATCRWVQVSMDAGTAEAAAVLHDEVDVEEHARHATDTEVPDEVIAQVESCLDAHRDAIASFYGVGLGTREGAGFIRYHVGGFYGPHVDRAHVPSWPAAADREITIVLFLNDSLDADPGGEFSGGVLRIYPQGLAQVSVDVVARRGMLVAFPASMPHEVTPVASGTRDTVVDWLYSKGY